MFLFLLFLISLETPIYINFYSKLIDLTFYLQICMYHRIQVLLQYSIIKFTNFRLTTMILMKALFHLEERSETKRKGWIQYEVYSVELVVPLLLVTNETDAAR